jgi:hypothetical protein
MHGELLLHACRACACAHPERNFAACIGYWMTCPGNFPLCRLAVSSMRAGLHFQHRDN